MTLEPKYSNSRALIVGIDKYKSKHCPPLNYAVSDADAVAKILQSKFEFPKENISTLTDKEATREAISSAFSRFAGKDVDVNERIFVFFAGHGHTQVGNRGEVGFLVPYDGYPQDISSLIRWDELTRNSDLIVAKHILFIMDTCYGGLAITRALPPGSMRFLKDMLLRNARQVLTAGKANEVVADSGGPIPNHSIFTGHLLQALDGKAATEDGVITANGVMAYTYERVAKDPNSRQTPHYGFFDGDGDFVFSAPTLKKLSEDEKKDTDILITIPSAINQANNETMEDLVTRIKECLSDPKFNIKLHDLIVQLIRETLLKTGEDNFKFQRIPFSGDEFSQRLRHYESSVDDLQSALVCLAYWGSTDTASLLNKALARLTDRLEPQDGLLIWSALRWYPLILLVYSSGIAALAAGKYDNLAKLFLMQVGLTHSLSQRTDVVLQVGDAIRELESSFKQLPGHEKHFVPRSEYLFKLLQPKLDDLLYLGKEYEQMFDKFEVLFALVHADLRTQNGDRPWGPIGRFGWKSSRGLGGNPLKTVIEDAKRHGDGWPPLLSGLFGGSHERFSKIALEYERMIGQLGWW